MNNTEQRFLRSITQDSTINYRPILVGLFKIIIYSLVLYTAAELMRFDAILSMGTQEKFTESSLTEVTQSVLLIATSAVYLIAFLTEDQLKPLAMALFSLSAASFIREQDTFLDEQVFDGAWQILVFTLLAYVIFYLLGRFREFIENIEKFMPTVSFGVFLIGFASTYVFSRLYGRTIFWKAVMENNYLRDVKNTSEECLELFGYSILLIASIEFILLANRLNNNLDSKSMVQPQGKWR